MTLLSDDPGTLLAACREVCDEVRLGEESDAIGTTMASVVAIPGSREEAGALLARTAKLDASVTFVGGRSKLGIGIPPTSLDLLVSTAHLDALIEHNAGDLVVRAEAGVPLTDLQAALASSDQWLALDPIEPDATLGGVVAANASGPRRLRYGTARDLLIGVTVVLADGTIARAGGKVVKNVAGYDLGKLMTGSYGTLALLVDMTFRLHPRLGARSVVSTPVDGIRSIEHLVRAYREAHLDPTAFELVVEVRTLTGGAVAVFESTGPAAEQQARQAAALRVDSAVSAVPPRDFGARPFEGDHVGLRIAHEPGGLISVLGLVRSVAERSGSGGRVVAHVGVGVTEVGIAYADASGAVDAVERLRAGVSGMDGSVVVIAAPDGIKAALDVWGPVRGLDLMRRVKAQFDPRHRLAPGRFVGGI